MTRILDAERRWSCPNCTVTAVTRGEGVRFHRCAGLAGLLAPMVLDGVRCEVKAVLRDDYVGGEDVRHDGEGRPVMAVTVTRDDGQDRVVYAPAAHARRS